MEGTNIFRRVEKETNEKHINITTSNNNNGGFTFINCFQMRRVMKMLTGKAGVEFCH